ncbi:c-type cytochrome [Pedobacter alpinus]|uniref:C-type cytochrome n=1 Tax=Pedobacter alpinus TaxID=1590643 RepID=A0ABW5TWA8_9SPHI
MKKYIGLCLIGAFLVACGGTQTTQESEETKETTATETANLKGQQLIAASDCLGCHKEQEKLIGPSYADVAKKYDNTPENVTMLAGKIINGGKGVWGEIPMAAHPQINQQDAEEMVKYIFTLK